MGFWTRVPTGSGLERGMRGSPGRIGGKGLEAIGQGELVPTGPSLLPPTPTPTLCCQLTHTATHKGWGGLGYGGLRSVTGDWSVMPRVYWLEICGQSQHSRAGVKGGTLEQQPPRERGHRSVAPHSEFTNLPWVPRGGISSKSGLCVSQGLRAQR